MDTHTSTATKYFSLSLSLSPSQPFLSKTANAAINHLPEFLVRGYVNPALETRTASALPSRTLWNREFGTKGPSSPSSCSEIRTRPVCRNRLLNGKKINYDYSATFGRGRSPSLRSALRQPTSNNAFFFFGNSAFVFLFSKTVKRSVIRLAPTLTPLSSQHFEGILSNFVNGS